MPTTPYAKALLSVNGGALQTTAQTVAGSSTIALSAESISDWAQARWEIYAYPRGWPTPAGWTLDATTGVIYSTSFTPQSFTLEDASTRWGKWLVRLRVNNQTKAGISPHPDLLSEVMGWEVLSPRFGLREIGLLEGGQFDAIRQWIDAWQRNLKALDNASKNGVLDFVLDCGADPTGVVDAGPAITAAWARLKALAGDSKGAANSFALYVPPGRYKIATTPTPADFNGFATSVEIYGEGDASIFELGGVSSAINIQGAPRIHVHDLAFVGTLNNIATPDATQAVRLSATYKATLERCHFDWILADQCVVHAQGAYLQRNCIFTGCGTKDSAKAVVWSDGCSSVDIENSQWNDISHLNGYGNPSNKAGASGVNRWFRHDDSGTLSGGGYNHYVSLRGNWWDETVLAALVIKGGPTANIGRVHLEGNYCNPASIAGATGCFRIENVDLLEVDGLVNSGFNTGVTPATLELVAVGRARLRGIVVNNSAASNYITADNACGRVDVEDSPTLTDIRLSAAWPDQIAGAVLAAWWAADKGIGVQGGSAKVANWGDQSLTGDAAKLARQATVGYRPARNNANASYNNKPTIDFDHTDDHMLSGTLAVALAQPFTVFVVGHTDNSGDPLIKIAIDATGGPQCSLQAGTGQVQMYAGANLNTAYSWTSKEVICGVFNGANSYIYRSAETAIAGPANAGGNGLAGVTIGSYGTTPAGGYSWGGPIAEVVIFDGALSATDIKRVLHYLGNKYGKAIAA